MHSSLSLPATSGDSGDGEALFCHFFFGSLLESLDLGDSSCSDAPEPLGTHENDVISGGGPRAAESPGGRHSMADNESGYWPGDDIKLDARKFTRAVACVRVPE